MRQLIGQVGRVFVNGSGDRVSIPIWVIPKIQKWYLMPPCLTLIIIRYGSRVKWSNPGKGEALSPVPLGVVANVKADFGSFSTTVANNFIIFIKSFSTKKIM